MRVIIRQWKYRWRFQTQRPDAKTVARLIPPSVACPGCSELKDLMFLKLIMWCWDIFLVVWLIGMFFNKRTVQRGTISTRVGYMALVFAAFWLLSGGVFRHLYHPFALVIVPHSAVVGSIALGLTICGLCLAIWARLVLGRNWSGTVTFKDNHELVVTGPYSFVRHPIYTALLLMFSGTALAVGTIGGILGAPVLFVSFWIKYQQEEALMIEHFGDQYRNYRKRVKAIIPFVF